LEGVEMKISGLLGAATVAAIMFGAPGVANATVEKIDFSGTFGGGTLTGVMILDVDSSGVATSGTATITAPGLPGPETMGLVPPDPPGGAYEAYDGTNLALQDDKYPITNVGLVFGTDAGPAPGGALHGPYTFGMELGGEAGGCPSTAVCGFLAGQLADGSYHEYGATGVLTLSNAVPEPSTWAMLMIGFGGLGFAALRKGRLARAVA
jgi:hypothetical protein